MKKAVPRTAARVTAKWWVLTTVFNADVVFMGVATLCLALLGWSVQTGALPWVVPGAESSFGALTTSFPPWGRAAFSVYMFAATTLGLVLPLGALCVWGRHTSVRAALLPYVLVLLVQIVVEVLFARIFFPNIVIVVGFVYTLYRIWRLWGVRSVFVLAAQPTGLAKSLVATVLSASLVFWSFNALFLTVIMIPRLVTAA